MRTHATAAVDAAKVAVDPTPNGAVKISEAGLTSIPDGATNIAEQYTALTEVWQTKDILLEATHTSENM